MRLHSLHIRNYRRLRDVHIDIDPKTSIFVGPNNSGKTSATCIFQSFLKPSQEKFSMYDFSADCWTTFNEIGSSEAPAEKQFPTISLDLWFVVTEEDLHRVIKLLPSLDWRDTPIGLRMEFAPKDTEKLLQRFREAYDKANSYAHTSQESEFDFHPWPESLTDYLRKRLNDEYSIKYFVLDYNEFDTSYKQKEGYTPQELGDSTETGSSIIKSLLRVDFLHAQRYLSDTDAKGRAEDLSKRLNRFYSHNLEKFDEDFTAVAALANSEAKLNEHLAVVFEPTLKNLNKLGYPGFADPHLLIKSAFEPESILSRNASVHYALRDPGVPESTACMTLPDKYNGLGFKNLIFMVVELLDFHQRWVDEKEERPPLHLVFIEEPEVHLHAQLQQVFIRKVTEILPKDDQYFSTQFVITTHSPHIVYESNFTPIRYFRRRNEVGINNCSEVLNLSKFYKQEDKTCEFLVRYMKLTHCDLFFADAAILIEGNVERLLLPLMIDMVSTNLKSRYISILELGGAFAHLFKGLINFLNLTTLIITDIDSVLPPAEGAIPTDSTFDLLQVADESVEDDEQDHPAGLSACMVGIPNAVTSNQTLIKWLPKLIKISDLLATQADGKIQTQTDTEPAKVFIAYQTLQNVTWKQEIAELAGRTFEEAFALENLTWCQDVQQRKLKLRVVKKNSTDAMSSIAENIHNRIKGSSFNKTDFAFALMMADQDQWVVPNYIAEGLRWLEGQIIATDDSDDTAATENTREVIA